MRMLMFVDVNLVNGMGLHATLGKQYPTPRPQAAAIRGFISCGKTERGGKYTKDFYGWCLLDNYTGLGETPIIG